MERGCTRRGGGVVERAGVVVWLTELRAVVLIIAWCSLAWLCSCVFATLASVNDDTRRRGCSRRDVILCGVE